MDARAFAPAVRVFVVDDSPLFRSAARELIDDTAGFVWIGEASNGEDGVEETLRLQPDLVLMDVRMPGIGGIEAASRIASHPSPPIVLLITGADLPDRVPDGTAGEILAKDHLNHASLRQAWANRDPTRAMRAVDRGRRPSRTSPPLRPQDVDGPPTPEQPQASA